MNARKTRTWKVTTTVVAVLRDHKHMTHTLRSDERLDDYATGLAREYGDRLVRVSYVRSEICDQTGEVADMTTSQFTHAELIELLDFEERRAARTLRPIQETAR